MVGSMVGGSCVGDFRGCSCQTIGLMVKQGEVVSGWEGTVVSRVKCGTWKI